MSVSEERRVDLAQSKERIAAELSAFLPRAAKLAVVPVSGFRVGAAALGGSGRVWLGANQEFAGLPLNFTVHAEQAAVLNARAGGETDLLMLAVSEAPCGYCRQFLGELRSPLEVVLNGQVVPLEELLPRAFALDAAADKGCQKLLCGQPRESLAGGSLRDVARNAAENSYSPYTGTKSGVALRCASGKIYAGSLIECGAYNPSLCAVQSALTLRALDGATADPIECAVLAERGPAAVGSLFDELMRQLAPDAVAERFVFEN